MIDKKDMKANTILHEILNHSKKCRINYYRKLSGFSLFNQQKFILDFFNFFLMLPDWTADKGIQT